VTTESTFRQRVKESLAKLDSSLEGVLASLITYQYPEEVFALSFEVFSDAFTSGFPVRVFFLDRTNTEYFIQDEGTVRYPSPVDPGLLELKAIYPTEFEDEAASADPALDVWEIATEELIKWFATRWQRAGGATFPRVATIAHHDSSRVFNLKSNLWEPS
jgi:hypothetical protein